MLLGEIDRLQAQALSYKREADYLVDLLNDSDEIYMWFAASRYFNSDLPGDPVIVRQRLQCQIKMLRDRQKQCVKRLEQECNYINKAIASVQNAAQKDDTEAIILAALTRRSATSQAPRRDPVRVCAN